MRALLPYFENELTFLRRRGQAFAREYPRLAGQLQWGADEAKDPHVERMIESFAFLTARINKRLDDDFPLFTESLLEVLYPHYLRPFPSASIAQFDAGAAAAHMSKVARIERGTVLNSRPVKGVTCRFRTTQDVSIAPVRIAEVVYRNSLVAPPGTAALEGATSMMSIVLEATSPQVGWDALAQVPLRLYLDGEPSQVSALREALCTRVAGIMVQADAHSAWQQLPFHRDGRMPLPSLAGFADEEALIDFDARSHPAYRLLTEYFAFPDKFNFVDVPWAAPPASGAVGSSTHGAAGGVALNPSTGTAHASRRLYLHVLFRGIRSDSDESRLLETVHARNLLLGCTPVVNLFTQPADPIRVTHTAAAYPVVVDARRAFGYEVYSIDRVFRVKQTPHGEDVHEFHPFFSLKHDELLARGARDGDLYGGEGHDGAGHRAQADAPPVGEHQGGRYWFASRDEAMASEAPGRELEIAIVDAAFNPALPQTDTLSLMVTATNRDLPELLGFGVPGGDLFVEGGSLAKEVRLLRKPTASQRFERGRGALWRLISHLSLNHLSLSGGGVDAIREMLRLYDLPRSPANRRQIDGLMAIEFRPATAWLPGEPYATFVRGTEVRLTVDEEAFVGTGLGLFTAIMERFFGLYAHINSFTRLTVISARTQEEVLSCPARNGEMPLV